MGDPVLDEDESVEKDDIGEPEVATPTPPAFADLQAEVAALREELRLRDVADQPVPAEPESPDDMVKVNFPPSVTGHPARINGVKYIGPMTVKRSVAIQVLSMLDVKRVIDEERNKPRGNAVVAGRVLGTDAASRIISRQPGRVVPV